MTFTAGSSASLPGPDWLCRVRREAAEGLDAAELPSASKELWRYSRIDELDLAAFHPAQSTAPATTGEMEAGISDVLGATSDRAALVVTRNGVTARVEMNPSVAAAGLEVKASAALAGDAPVGSVAGLVDLFARLNSAFALDPIVVDIPSGLVVPKPIVIVHWCDERDAAVFPRVVVRSGEGSEATVCECHISADVVSLSVPVTELDVAQSSNLRYVVLQLLGTRMWQIAYQASRVQRDATFRSSTVALGGDYARVRTDSQLVGVGGSSKLNAVYFGSESQMHDFRTLQDHRGQKTTSDLLFKGAVGDSARSVYSGLIRVDKGASGTNAFQTNRNLVLSEGAHADSVPNLEIEENDVRCSHASAVGPIDEDQRYYLESRGVPTDIAERLIVLGFLDEIVNGLPVGGVRALLRGAIARKLDVMRMVR